MKHPKEYDDSDKKEPGFRVTSFSIRANRAIAPFVHVRAEVSVSVLKGADKDAARQFAATECNRLLSEMQHLERSPLNKLDIVDDKLEGVDDRDIPF